MGTIVLDKETLDTLNIHAQQRESKLTADIVAMLNKPKEPDEVLKKEEVEVLKKEEVEHEQLKGLLEVKIMGMPLGKAFVGGGAALLVSELVDGLVAPRIEDMLGKTWGPALLKGGTAWAVKQWGPGLVGREAANIATIFLLWEAVRSIIPIDEWIKKMFAKKEATSSSSESHNPESSSGGNGHHTDAMDTLRLQLAGGR